MLKIGILTEYYNSTNYGGVLQAYALEKNLQMLGYDAEQICYQKDKEKTQSRKTVLVELLRSGKVFTAFKRITAFIYNRFVRYWIRFMNNQMQVKSKADSRSNAFFQFRESVILHSNSVFNSKSIVECKDYDCYITGSDEVWRISGDKLNPAYWLTFIQAPKRKISYAASISMPSIPEKMQHSVRQALSDFTAISVRQNTDKQILESLTGRTVEWVLDPTLLLSQNDWNTVATENVYKSQKYIFTYFLGNSKKHRNCAVKYAKTYGYKIINIPYLFGNYRSCDKNFGDFQISAVSPELWISLIRDAQYVFTDSFHGMVFSLLFHKPFFVFLRDNNGEGSRNSRIFSFVKLFNLEDRLINDDRISEIGALKEIDYNKVDEVLERERKKSIDFLINALEG